VIAATSASSTPNIIGAAFVTVPATFVLNQYREQIQWAVYWLPMLVAGAGGAVALIAVAPVIPAGTRFRVILVAVFEALLLIGSFERPRWSPTWRIR
jgi:hypothetical protein